jgi:putative redox protein
MAQVNVTWVQNKTFLGTDSTNHSVVMSSVDDGVGMKPSELLLVALGGCTAYDIVGILEKKRANLQSVQVSVTGEQANEAPWSFQRIHIHYSVSGTNLRDQDVARAIELSERKYCSVSATLRPQVEITTDYEIREAALLA